MNGDWSRYDTAEGQPSVGPEYHREVDHSGWTLRMLVEAGGTITRVRWLREGRYCDISYIHGTLPNGQIVAIYGHSIPNLTLLSQRKWELVAWARREGVYALGIGLLDMRNWSTL